VSQVRRSEAFWPGSHLSSFGPTFKKLRYLGERRGGMEGGEEWREGGMEEERGGRMRVSERKKD
jgi:hypothetical protein